MNNAHTLFRGAVSVYLQGQNALVPISLSRDQLTSMIGSEETNLVIRDHRSLPIGKVSEMASSGSASINFAAAFNQSAWAEVNYSPEQEGLEIDLFETQEKVELPILWMGILEDNKMPAYEVEWEIFKLLDENTTAFCALIPQQG